jgi:hypothetical protein
VRHWRTPRCSRSKELENPSNSTDRVTAKGSDTAESFEIVPAATAGHVETSRSTATLMLATAAERLRVETLGGDDTVTAADGVAALTALTIVD